MCVCARARVRRGEAGWWWWRGGGLRLAVDEAGPAREAHGGGGAEVDEDQPGRARRRSIPSLARTRGMLRDEPVKFPIR